MGVVAGRRRPALAYRNGIPVTKYAYPFMPGSMLVVLRRNVRHAVRRSRARGDGRTPHGIYTLCLLNIITLFTIVYHGRYNSALRELALEFLNQLAASAGSNPRGAWRRQPRQ